MSVLINQFQQLNMSYNEICTADD